MKNFKIILLLILSFVFLWGGAACAEKDLVKVGLYYSSSARNEYSVASAEGLYVASLGEEIFPLGCNKVNIKKVCFSSDEEIASAQTTLMYDCGIPALWKDYIGVYSESGSLLYISEGKAEIFSYDNKVKLTAIATKEYRGGALFHLTSDGKLNLINYVDMEDYLYSVISREMSPGWPVEALKAQAVCARNYATRNKGKHSSYGFDLCDSVCCQAYGGTSAEAQGSYAPVDETRGMLLYYGNEIAQVFYSSSMGPTTEDVKYVWGSNFPYLTSVDNPYEDYENVYNGVWKNTLTKKRATEIMATKGYNIGDVTEIRALEYSPSGRVIKLLVKGTNGEKVFERESCRTIFSEVTLSQLYTISGGGEEKLPKVAVVGADYKRQDVIKPDNEIKGRKVMTGNGEKTLGNSFSAIGKDGIKNFRNIITGDPETYTFSGMGWGHGIGMSQYGAKGMAEAGFTYEEILTHYFRGTEIRHYGL